MKKILVIDDSTANQTAARTLADSGYEVTVVGTYEEAVGLLLCPEELSKRVKNEVAKKGIQIEDGMDAYYAARKEVHNELKHEYVFDAVLCDLLMPCEKGESLPLSPHAEYEFKGQEMPFGFPLAIMAAMSGAKRIGVVTDTNHHDHPMSATLDPFEWWRTEGRTHLLINGAVLKFFQYPKDKGEHWNMILKMLLADEPPRTLA